MDNERAEALARLREWLKPGDTVWTVLRHVSRSGMQHTIECVLIEDDKQGNGPEVREIGWAVARALGMTFDRDRGGVKVGGGGMDMGFELVYRLGRALWPEGFGCIGANCRSNDHTNGDRDYTPHMNGAPNTFTPGYVGHWHRDGGYALRQRWI